jgi:hypothetical protein
VLLNDTRIGLDKNYHFDQVFPPETTNPQVKMIYLSLQYERQFDWQDT